MLVAHKTASALEDAVEFSLEFCLRLILRCLDLDLICRLCCIFELRLFEYDFLCRFLCCRLFCRCCRDLFRLFLSECCKRTSLFLRLEEIRKVEPASARLDRLFFRSRCCDVYFFRGLFGSLFSSFLNCFNRFFRRSFLCGFFYLYFCCRLFSRCLRCFRSCFLRSLFSRLFCLNCFFYLYFVCRCCLLLFFRNVKRSDNRCVYVFIKRSEMELRNFLFLFLCCRCFRFEESRIKNFCVLERLLLFNRCLRCRCSRCFFSLCCFLLFLFSLEYIDEAHRAAALSGCPHLSVQLVLVNAAGSCPWGLDVRNGLLLRLVYYIAPVECSPLLERCLYRLDRLRIRCCFSESESCRFFFNLRYFENLCYSCSACAAKSCSLWKLATAICTEHYVTSAILRLCRLSISCSRAGLSPAKVYISPCSKCAHEKRPIYIIIQ